MVVKERKRENIPSNYFIDYGYQKSSKILKTYLHPIIRLDKFSVNRKQMCVSPRVSLIPVDSYRVIFRVYRATPRSFPKIEYEIKRLKDFFGIYGIC